MKLLSQRDRIYYRSELVKLLEGCTLGKKEMTGHFYQCASCFVGDKGALLRRCLYTLVSLGYMEFNAPALNLIYWSITQKGIDYLATYDPLNPTPLT